MIDIYNMIIMNSPPCEYVWPIIAILMFFAGGFLEQFLERRRKKTNNA